MRSIKFDQLNKRNERYNAMNPMNAINAINAINAMNAITYLVLTFKKSYNSSMHELLYSCYAKPSKEVIGGSLSFQCTIAVTFHPFVKRDQGGCIFLCHVAVLINAINNMNLFA
jgi:hypothetical protein